MTPDDRLYFAKRAAQEQARATAAPCPEVRCVHEELAARYTARLQPCGLVSAA